MAPPIILVQMLERMRSSCEISRVYACMEDHSESEESESERELSPDARFPLEPPKKKLKQTTLPFAAATTNPTCHAQSCRSGREIESAGSGSRGQAESAGSTSQAESAVSTSQSESTTTICVSDCCNGDLVPHQPTETRQLESLQRK